MELVEQCKTATRNSAKTSANNKIQLKLFIFIFIKFTNTVVNSKKTEIFYKKQPKNIQTKKVQR